jgi:hypothetical protein
LSGWLRDSRSGVSIPKGLRPPAQGCDSESYPGKVGHHQPPTSKRLRPS